MDVSLAGVGGGGQNRLIWRKRGWWGGVNKGNEYGPRSHGDQWRKDEAKFEVWRAEFTNLWALRCLKLNRIINSRSIFLKTGSLNHENHGE